MARKILKRYLPDPDKMRQHPSVKVFGTLLHDPNLWHLNRYSVSVAFFIGLFTAFVPLPGQMLIAALAAIVMRANLPISVTLVWITNPLTMPALFYIAYKFGAVLLNVKTQPFSFELSWYWVAEELAHKWQPFLLGCFILGLFFGLLGGAGINMLWRAHVIHRWRVRRRQRAQKY